MRSCADARRVAAIAFTALSLWGFALPASGQPTARTLYARALALDRGLARDGASGGATLQGFRRAVAAYELVVRRFPRSGYCDNALWQAAELSAEAARRHGRAFDRTKAADLLGWLVREYPRSALIARARTRMTGLAAPSPPASKPVIERPQSPKPPPAPPLAAPHGGPTAPGPARVRSLRRTVLTDIVRVTIEVDREVNYRTQRLDRPSRLQMDIEESLPADGLMLGMLTYRDAELRRVLIGRPTPEVVRFQFDLDAASRFSVFTLYDPFRLVIDVDRPRVAAKAPEPAIRATAPLPVASRPTAFVPPPPPGLPFRSSPVTPLLSSRSFPAGPATLTTVLSETLGAAVPVSEPGRAVAEAPRATAVTPARPGPRADSTAAPAAPVAPPAANAGGGFSMARQLGLGVSRVVIDPGHGGHDPGASGRNGSESEVVLDIALRLEKLLVPLGIDVVLTRRSDEYVALEERTAIANRAHADLFVSIHANASRNPQARGVETYFLNFSSNPDAEAVAARENATSARTMASLSDIVRAIALNTKLDESRDLAGQVQQALVRRLRGSQRGFRDLGVKQAPFVVLIGAAMPSILAEVSFITHGQEGKLLRVPAFRQKVAEALLDGLRRYQTSLKTARANLDRRPE